MRRAVLFLRGGVMAEGFGPEAIAMGRRGRDTAPYLFGEEADVAG